MRIVAFATDFDGTLAEDGKVRPRVLDGLRRLRESGRRLLLVSGRQVEPLVEIFDDLDLFDVVVAENGAVLYYPDTGRSELLGEPVPPELVAALEARDVSPVEAGEGIVGIWRPYDSVALEVIRELDLDYQIVFNRDAVMLIPAGVSKATGLVQALRSLGISRYNTVAIGDAENDRSFLRTCGVSFAVANALPGLKVGVDGITSAASGDGVVEVIDLVLRDELPRGADAPRHRWTLTTDGPTNLKFPWYGAVVLVCGPPESGKSNLVSRMLDALMKQELQCCVVDPEGDYEYARCTHIGATHNAPHAPSAARLLQSPNESVVINLLAVPGPERQDWFNGLIGVLEELERTVGRPHWLVLDEAHHVLYEPVPFPGRLTAPPFTSAILATVRPGNLAGEVLDQVTHLVALGPEQADIIAEFAASREIAPPALADGRGSVASYWVVGQPEVHGFQPLPPRADRARHARKYAEVDLGPERSFHFRGPENAVDLEARNLREFVDLADVVDEDTWLYHLGRGDYSRWLGDAVRDWDLAARVQAIHGGDMSGDASRRAVRQLIRERYGPPP